jgi:hypothetical protein
MHLYLAEQHGDTNGSLARYLTIKKKVISARQSNFG